MKTGCLGIAALVVGLMVLLGVFAYVLDHGRATTRIVAGLGEATEASLVEAFVTPEVVEEEGEGEDFESGRVEMPRVPKDPSGLVVRVVDSEGRGADFLDLLAFRGGELVRAGVVRSGTATMIPFDGPASLRVERAGFEFARGEVPDGHGQHEIVVAGVARVSGTLRLDGVPRAGIWVQLESGSTDWLDVWVAYGLENAGLRERSSVHQVCTATDGSFRFDWLPPGWSGALRLVDDEAYRFVGGAARHELTRPEEALDLELEALQPEQWVRGRVVFEGKPVPEAWWELEGSTRGRCDEFGNFSIAMGADERERRHLEFSQPGLGVREVTLDPRVPCRPRRDRAAADARSALRRALRVRQADRGSTCQAALASRDGGPPSVREPAAL